MADPTPTLRPPVRRFLPLWLLGALALLAAACSSSPQDVAVVGDSITVLVGDRLGSVEHRWDVEATIGATAQQMRPAAQQLASSPHDQAIVNLGTNDALGGVALDTTTTNLRAIIDGFDDVDCVHLVTITTQLPPSGTDAGRAAAEINDWLRATADGSDRVRLIDWDAEVAGSADLLRPDGIHPNDRGRARLVDLMADAVSSC